MQRLIALVLLFSCSASQAMQQSNVPLLQNLALRTIVKTFGNILDDTDTSNKRALETFFITADGYQEAIPSHFKAELRGYLMHILPDAESQLNPLKASPAAVTWDKLTISDVVFIAISTRMQKEQSWLSIETKEAKIYPHLTRTYMHIWKQHAGLRGLLEKTWIIDFWARMAKLKLSGKFRS